MRLKLEALGLAKVGGVPIIFYFHVTEPCTEGLDGVLIRSSELSFEWG